MFGYTTSKYSPTEKSAVLNPLEIPVLPVYIKRNLPSGRPFGEGILTQDPRGVSLLKVHIFVFENALEPSEEVEQTLRHVDTRKDLRKLLWMAGNPGKSRYICLGKVLGKSGKFWECCIAERKYMIFLVT